MELIKMYIFSNTNFKGELLFSTLINKNWTLYTIISIIINKLNIMQYNSLI